MKELQGSIRFIPILKERIWGGKKIITILNKLETKDKIGESWEISSVEGDMSIVSEGIFKGRSLQRLLEDFKEDFIGKQNYKQFGTQFPLLIKFIDASDDLSIQVHPNDELAKKRHNSFGKTEMWYVMEAEEDSELVLGFNQDLSKEKYQSILEEGTLEKYLHYEQVKKGDSFFVKAGLIHAIGKGVLIAEIQQTSDLTYRVYDWNRKDDKGNERELHTELALDALNYKKTNDFKLHQSGDHLISSPYFTVNLLSVDNPITRNLSKIDSFVIYMGVDGEIEINDDRLKMGETLLFPAVFEKKLALKGKGKVLEIYIKNSLRNG